MSPDPLGWLSAWPNPDYSCRDREFPGERGMLAAPRAGEHRERAEQGSLNAPCPSGVVVVEREELRVPKISRVGLKTKAAFRTPSSRWFGGGVGWCMH